MLEFKPAEDYLNLKKQALALHRIFISQEAELRMFKQYYYDLLNEIKLQRINEVEALRNENERLTNLLESK